MADFTLNTLASQVSGWEPLNQFEWTDSQPSVGITPTDGTISIENIQFNLNQRATRGHLTGRRPVKGLLFPRGYFNK